MHGVTPQRLRFGLFEADLKAGELRKHDRRLRLQEKPFQVLEALLEHPGETLTRQELRERLWPADTFGDFDNGLNNAVNKLRLALGDSATTPRFIETVGRGYRFIGAIEEVPAAEGRTAGQRTIEEPIPALAPAPEPLPTNAAAAPALSSVAAPDRPRFRALVPPRAVAASFAVLVVSLLVAAAAGRPRMDRLAAWLGLRRTSAVAPLEAAPGILGLAVLPLRNLTGDASQDYIAYGITDTLIAELARLDPLKVISQTSVMDFGGGSPPPLPEIARDLGVDTIIEGSIHREGPRVRISLSLVEARTSRYLWADSFEGPQQDVLRLRAEIVRAVIPQVQRRVMALATVPLQTTTRTTMNLEAYEQYLHGISHLERRNPADLARAVEYFQQALALDPDFALAYAGLAWANLGQEVWGGETLGSHAAEVRQAVSKALALDPNLAEAHAARGAALRTHDWDWPGAEAALRRAIQLKPSLARAHSDYSYLLQVLGRFEEAVAEAHRAVVLDPRAPQSWVTEGRALYRARRYAEAEERYRRAIALGPGYGFALDRLVELYLAEQRLTEAEQTFKQLEQVPSYRPLGGLRARLAAASGDEAAARRLVAGPAVASMPNGIMTAAAVYTELGERDRAFAALDRGVAQRTILPFQMADPELDPLRSDPRFAHLLRRMGLPADSVVTLVSLPAPAPTRADGPRTPDSSSVVRLPDAAPPPLAR